MVTLHYVVSALLLMLGLFSLLTPTLISRALTRFYSRYPLTHRAGKKQLTSRLQFIRAAGLTSLLLGLFILLMPFSV